MGMVSLGCPKNQVDAEILLAELSGAGYDIVSDAALAEVVIVNTCGFIQSAKQESIENILEFCTLKKEGQIKKIVVTGCLAQRYRDEVLAEIPELDAVVGIGKNAEIVSLLEEVCKGNTVSQFAPAEQLPLSGERILTTPPFFAYLKIAEGCDNCCSYCAIPLIRGCFRSRPIEDILEEARQLAKQGVRELILVAQDTTRYGEDIYKEYMLPQLLRKLNQIEELTWIRVLYAYPDRVTDELLQAMAQCDKVVKYLDLPLQHVNERILQRMNRRGNRQSLLNLISKIRKMVPGIVLRSTMICGFPGETEEEFLEMLEFVREAKIERLGCFAYSREEGTPAAEFADQIPEEIAVQRAELVNLEQQRIMEEFAALKVRQTVCVMLESYDRYAEMYFGRTAGDAPEIDPKVFFSGGEKLMRAGERYEVAITDTEGVDLIGKLKL